MCFYSAENPLSPGTRMIFETLNGTHAAMEDAVVRSLLFGKPSLFRRGGGFLQSKNTWKRRVCQKTGLIQTLNFWVHPRLMRGFTTDASRVKHVAFVRFRKAIFMILRLHIVGGRAKFAVWTHPFIHESSVTNFNIFTLKNVKKC